MTAATEREGLLPCPFCGETADLVELAGNYYVSCNGCEVQQIAKYTPEAATAAWNRRAPGWRPIETAPRDGAFIDIWAVKDDMGSRFPDCRWKDFGPILGGWGWEGINEGFTPTHWMHEPSAPR